jgi:hypothetical protein
MKVIAKVDNNRVLCEVTLEELAFLNGYPSTYTNGCNKEHISMVGAECNLKKMVNTSRFVRSIRPDTLQKTKQQLEELISKLNDTMETVSGLELFNILNEEQQIGE